MTETIPGWDDAEEIDPDQVSDVSVPGTRPRVQHEEVEAEPAVPAWAHTARIYRVGTQEVELYPISVLTEVTGLKYGTIRKWEREGTFPKARFRSPRRGQVPGHRLYTRPFIEGVRDLLKSEDVSESHRNIHATNFVRRVHALFKGTGG